MSRARGRVSPRATGEVLREYFDRMLAHFGPRGWWPASSRFEVCIGAILTQNTSWTNVERAIANLKRDKLLCPRALVEADPVHVPARGVAENRRQLRFPEGLADAQNGPDPSLGIGRHAVMHRGRKVAYAHPVAVCVRCNAKTLFTRWHARAPQTDSSESATKMWNDLAA